MKKTHMKKDKLPPSFGTRHFGLVNQLGLYTLYQKEVRRFWKVGFQTVGAPIITTLLFLVVFMLALGDVRPDINGISFIDFLIPGLIMMAIIQNAFANSSSSLLISKIQGNIVDVLMPPLSSGELVCGFALGGLTRGLVVGVGVLLALMMFVDVSFFHIWAILYFSIASALLLSLAGFLVGIWSEKFDHMQAITNFVIVPLSFLSGTFYSVEQLPQWLQTFSIFNPFFYMIDGFRYGFTGQYESNLLQGVIILLLLNILLWFWSYYWVKIGYRIKS